MTNRVHDLVLAELTRHGLTWRVEHRGKHQAIVFALPDGRERRLFFAVSPSDRRAPVKQRATLRRMLRDNKELAR
jgi:hypothetical protein